MKMTRRRFYAPPIAFSHDGQSATLSAEETRHLRDVLRLRVGDEAYVFDGEGREFRGSVSNTDRSSSVLRIIEEAQPPSPESSLNLTLAVALLKGEKFDVVVQKATELGAGCVVPLITSRADVRIHNPEDAQKKQARWQRIALEATKQCGRAKLIKIDAPVAFAEFVARPSVNLAADNELCLMFSERNGIPFADAVDSIEQPPSVKAIVGSEGGWTDEELQQASAAQWKIVTLGGRTLRAETAAIAVAALLQHRFGDL
jgi:16S rRNA (uracil1498-N3)-methyltransferase